MVVNFGIDIPFRVPHLDTLASVHPPPSLTAGTGASPRAAYLQIRSSILLNYVVIDGKVTHFCPILTTFVPRIRNIYEESEDYHPQNDAE